MFERTGKVGRKGRETSMCERNIDRPPLLRAPTRDQACNPGSVPWLGIEPVTPPGRMTPNQLSHTSQGPAPTENTVLWSPQQSLCGHPGGLACSQLLSVSGSLLCGAAGPQGRTLWLERVRSAKKRQTPSCLSMDHGKRTGKSAIRVQVTSQLARSSREQEFLCSPRTVLTWVRNRPGALSKWSVSFPNCPMLCVGPPPNPSLPSPG